MLFSGQYKLITRFYAVISVLAVLSVDHFLLLGGYTNICN